MQSRSGRILVSLVGAALVVGLDASSAEAQGWRDRLKKVAIEKTGLGGAADAAEAARILIAFRDARNTVSPLAGTYRVTYTINHADSATLYFRTFDKFDIPLGYSPEGADGPVDFTRGALMNVVIGRSLDSLPGTREEFRASVAAIRAAGHAPGQGFLMSMRDTTIAAGAEGHYAVAVQASLIGADSTEKAFWERVGSGFVQMGSALNGANEREDEGTPTATQVKRGDLGPFVDVRAEGLLVVDYDGRTNHHDVVHIHAERLSTKKLIR
jgi:hypothetical protein